jgi:ribosome biogenesis protein MAK21
MIRLIFPCFPPQSVTDRFYRTLYESLLDKRLVTTSKQAMYVNLLFKALGADHSLGRLKAFIKRIVQVAAHHEPPFICGVFILLSKVKTYLLKLLMRLSTY